MNYNIISEKLNRYNQHHLFRFFEELTDDQKQNLINQIEKIEFSALSLQTEKKENYLDDNIKPIKILNSEEREKKKILYKSRGVEALQKNKIGLVLLAGGQGSRLGFDKPKGMLDIGLKKEIFSISTNYRQSNQSRGFDR